MHKLLRLPRAEQWLLLKTLLLVTAIRGGLFVLPYPTLRRIVARMMSRTIAARNDRAPVERIVWCVRVASRYVPRATCLTQALSTQVLMARRRYQTELRIGVARDSKGAFNAHAWLEHEGRIVIGELGYEEFTPLPQFDITKLQG